jgi:hypothetical protein
MKKSTLSVYLAAGAVVAIGLACGKKDDGKSNPFDAPAMKPPVENQSPTGFKAAAISLSADAGLAEIKSRFYGDGPTDFVDRLTKVDSRIAEFESRASGEDVGKCVTEEPQLWDLKDIPGVGSFPMYFSCYDRPSQSQGTSLSVYFGKKDGYWYVAELSKNEFGNEPPTIGVLAKVNEAGTETTVVQLSIETNFTTSVFHVYANDSTKVFEMANASNRTSSNGTGSGANYTGVGCGVRLKANANFVYGVGKFTSENCGSATTSTVCAKASDLTNTNASDCTGADLDSFSAAMNLTAAELGNVEATGVGYVKVKAIIDGTGLPVVSQF